jgi:metallo-beta-lactamase family protein
VNIFGERFDVRCGVETMDSFSGHGDYNEMLEFFSCQNPERVKEVFLVHGEYETQIAFKLKLEKAGYGKIHIPALYEGVKI